jgi:hypothetical protein
MFCNSTLPPLVNVEVSIGFTPCNIEIEQVLLNQHVQVNILMRNIQRRELSENYSLQLEV